MTQFEQCTEMTGSTSEGRVEIKCKLGFWSVFAPTRELAVREAMHYFSQYRSDGEYHSIIGGKTPAQVLMERRNE